MQQRERELLARFREQEHGRGEPAGTPRAGSRSAERRPTGRSWPRSSVLFLFSIVLAAAETAFTRMSRIRALSLEEEGRKGAHRLAIMLERPERTLNVLLLLILVCQMTSASLLGILLEGAFGSAGIVIGLVLQIVLYFVIGEVAPKTYAIQHVDRAALRLTPFLWGDLELPAAAAALVGPHRPRQRAAPGQGPEGGPVRHRGGPPHDGRRRGRRGGDRARGAPAHPLDLRVRRHRRPRGDGAASRHDRDRGRAPPSRTRSAAPSRPATRASRATRTPPTTSSGSCT